MGDGLWLEAAARVQASVDAEARDEAYEVFVAEAARCRLEDRTGRVELRLRSGAALPGRLDASERVDGHVALHGEDGRRYLVPVVAIAVMSGSRAALRNETGDRDGTLTQWLRDVWSTGESVRVLDAAGAWRSGTIDFVGADHVELIESAGANGASRPTVLPLTSVEAWGW